MKIYVLSVMIVTSFGNEQVEETVFDAIRSVASHPRSHLCSDHASRVYRIRLARVHDEEEWPTGDS